MTKKVHAAFQEGQVLVVHPDEELLKRIISMLEKGGYKVTICVKGEQARDQTVMRRFQAILYGAGVKDIRPPVFFKEIRDNPLLAHIPLFVLESPGDEDHILHESLEEGADAILPLRFENVRFCETLRREIGRSLRFRLDPVTALPFGASLMRKLEYMCDRSERQWHFLLVKVHGIRAFSIHSGYDKGDELIRAGAQMLEETLDESGESMDFAGRISGSRLCVVTTTKQPEGLCRKILGKSERAFRRFYSPYEWVKGYLTVEDGKYAGNYHLAEVMIACLSVPARWDNHYMFLLDIADEVGRQVEKDGGGYRIINL